MANKRTIELNLEGLDKLSEQLKTLDRRVQFVAAQNAVISGARVVQKAAKKLAPVYRGPINRSFYRKKRKPGALKRSIRTVFRFFPSQGVFQGAVGVRDPLGHLIEYGHKTKQGSKVHRNVFSHFRKARTKEGGKAFIGPRPYLRPAFDENKDRVLDAMQKEVAAAMWADRHSKLAVVDTEGVRTGAMQSAAGMIYAEVS